MTEVIDTKALKALREADLDQFLEQIKADGSWRQWLNSSNELHIAKVCKHRGAEEGQGKSWDSTCFRGGKWAEPYKEAFNKWVKSRLADAIDAQDTDLFGNPLRTVVMLPPGLSFDGLSDEMVNFIKDNLAEIKRQKDKVKELQSRLDTKERKVLELETELCSIMESVKASDEHFFSCARTLHYD